MAYRLLLRRSTLVLLCVIYIVLGLHSSTAESQQQEHSEGRRAVEVEHAADEEDDTDGETTQAEVSVEFNASSYVTYSVPLGTIDSNQLIVLDNVFSQEEVSLMEAWLTSKMTSWMFHGLDASEYEPQPYSLKNRAPWTAMLSSEGFSKSAQWHKVKAAASGLFTHGSGGGDGGAVADWQLASIVGYVLRHGDQVLPDNGQQNETSLVAHIYLARWMPVYGGETLLLSPAEQSPRSSGCIQPGLGRFALFPASATRIMHPPSINCPSVLVYLELRLTRSSTEYDNLQSFEKSFTAEVSARNGGQYEAHLFNDALAKRENQTYGEKPEDHLVKSYRARNGKRLAVFDGFMDNTSLSNLRDHIVHRSSYQFDKSMSGTDNVKWIAGFEAWAFTKSELYVQLQKIVDYFTGVGSYYPHDVSCNLIRTTDTTTVHEDCEPDENDVTLLVYLNPNWTRNMFGETLFLVDAPGQSLESVAAIRPRYGRVAIFDGTFKHSARPPSSSFHGARYTFAVKYSASKELAAKKDPTGDAGDDDQDEDDGDSDSMIDLPELEDLMEEILAEMGALPNGKMKDKARKLVRKINQAIKDGRPLARSEVMDVMDSLYAAMQELRL
ncbi:uncharacterized protein LOC135815602 [Sycon ciliatum]|uniref:uncharacterized protein LOC135815602 n=1 Tax=Sycon ciliatum TaxID=27933 RepID=UPI0031F6A7FF